MSQAALQIPSNVAWQPQPGSQALFLTCPVYEILYDGTRGVGKTVATLMKFAQYVGKGFGQHWRGVIFRQSYPQLADVVAKSRECFHRIFPGAKFNATSYTWTWPTGETLFLRYMDKPSDYWNYHGHEYPFVMFEEMTNWPTQECYDAMKACSRSAHQGMPRFYGGNSNPFGVGHHWVKARFVDPAPPGVIVKDDEGLERVRIFGSWQENQILLDADPDYPKRLAGDSDESRRKAWLEGDWDIVAGGFFSDIWDARIHVLPQFQIPESWRVDRSFDWGSAKPFSVGWWAQSDGTAAYMADGTARYFPRGSIVRFAEWYGWDEKTPNVGIRMTARDIGRGIVEREYRMKLKQPVKAGPADASIFAKEDEHCIAEEFAKVGVHWTPSQKGPGSRKQGWGVMRQMLNACRPPEGADPMWRPEDPCLYVMDNCRQFIRTVPVLPRDELDPEDVDSDAEDHVADEVRYRCLDVRMPRAEARSRIQNIGSFIAARKHGW